MTLNKYERITVEISGICNAKCTWCYTGRQNKYGKGCSEAKAKFMTAQEFDSGLSYLINNGILSPNAEVELYNWGEPLLNPELDGILEVLEKYDMQFHLSTNCSCLKYFTGKHLKNMTMLMVSLSGFSQSTYGRIHDFDFESILRNINTTAEILKSHNLLHLMEVNFHVYNFNLHEIAAARKYFESRNIRFIPRIAYFNDYFLFDGYLKNTLPIKTKAMAEKHLLTDLLLRETEFAPKNFECPQQKKIVVDEEWNLVPCCRLSKKENLGSILDMNIEEVAKAKKEVTYCGSCLSTGQSFVVHQELKFQYGVSERLVPYRFIPKLLVDYNGKGFYWFSTACEGSIRSDGSYSHRFEFPTPPKKLRVIVPRPYNNVHLMDVVVTSNAGILGTSQCSRESGKMSGLFEKTSAAFDICLDDKKIKWVEISFGVSYLSDSFVNSIS